jgi:hypothetical protein
MAARFSAQQSTRVTTLPLPKSLPLGADGESKTGACSSVESERLKAEDINDTHYTASYMRSEIATYHLNIIVFIIKCFLTPLVLIFLLLPSLLLSSLLLIIVGSERLEQAKRNCKQQQNDTSIAFK